MVSSPLTITIQSLQTDHDSMNIPRKWLRLTFAPVSTLAENAWLMQKAKRSSACPRTTETILSCDIRMFVISLLPEGPEIAVLVMLVGAALSSCWLLSMPRLQSIARRAAATDTRSGATRSRPRHVVCSSEHWIATRLWLDCKAGRLYWLSRFG